jgi:hypothetical protein
MKVRPGGCDLWDQSGRVMVQVAPTPDENGELVFGLNTILEA